MPDRCGREESERRRAVSPADRGCRGALARGRSTPAAAGPAFRALAVLLAVLAWAGAGGCGREGKPGMANEDAVVDLDRSFQPLRLDFEGAAGKVRLVGIVGPTCGHCLENLTAIHGRLLERVPGRDFEVFIVWAAVLPADVRVRARQHAERWADPRIRHYWDDSGRIARAFGQHAGLPEGRPISNLFYLYGRDDTWDPGGAMANEPSGWNAILEGWQPAPARARWGGHPHLRLPVFDTGRIAEKVEALLAEPSR